MLKGRHIAVLMGGPGSERDVSLKSAESVVAALRALGAQVWEVDVRGPDFEVPAEAEIAFNVIHGTFGEDGQLQQVLEERGVRYTGARAESSRRAFDKIESKRAFEAAGVRTPRHEVVALEVGAAPGLPLPLVLKPPREGSSVGVHIIREPGEVPLALEDLRRFGPEALAEQFIEGAELTVGILGDEVLPVIHIRPRSGFYDMRNKYPWMGGGGGSDYICPADISAEATRLTQEAALAAHRALGVEVYSRVDLMLDAEGTPWVLEVNTIPGMTPSSLLPKAAQAAGIDFPALCSRLVELSLDLR